MQDYDHEILKDTTIGEFKAWKILMTPKEEAAVVWGKIEAYIGQGDYLQLLFKYYDEDDYLINTMVLSEMKKMGGRVVPSRLEMIPAENPDQKTIIIYNSLEFDTGIKPDFFSIQNMKRVR